MSVYTIAVLEFTDEAAYRRYQAEFPAIFARYEGRVVIADEAPISLEGNIIPDKIVVLEFPDAAASAKFAIDPDYVRISKDRKAGTKANVWLTQGR